MKSRLLSYIIGVFVVPFFYSCNDKLACPAYTSYFILDNSNADLLASANRGDYPDPSYLLRENDIRDKYFSYIGEDSMPRTDMRVPRKDQFGIIQKPGFLTKRSGLNMIPMEVVIPEASDSIKFGGDIELLAELENIDSAAIDSASLQGRTYKYNLDQKYYLWYLKNKLVWKDGYDGEEEDLTDAIDVEGVEVTDDAPKEGFFKRIFGNLFKKKDKSADPATETPVDETEEEDPEGF